MRTVSTIILLLLLFPSCTKDKTTPPCTGVSMSGERERFTGKWRWYKTIVEEWFDLGPPVYHTYTPANQGFEYYFTISSDGIIEIYKNDTLIQKSFLSKVKYEYFEGSDSYVMELAMDCKNRMIDLRQYVGNVTNDSIHTLTYPLNFDDTENHLKTHGNYFVRE